MARLQMARQRVAFEELGCSLVLLPGWSGVGMNPLLGAFLSLQARPHEAVLNLRIWSDEDAREARRLLGAREPGSAARIDGSEPRIDGRDLARLLCEAPFQEWNAAPADRTSAHEAAPGALPGAILLEGATFPPAGERVELARVWMVSDGHRLAEALATPLIAREPELIAACEEMLRSLRFE